MFLNRAINAQTVPSDNDSISYQLFLIGANNMLGSNFEIINKLKHFLLIAINNYLLL